MNSVGVGEPVLSEDLSQVPSTNVERFIITCNSSSMASNLLASLAPAHVWHSLLESHTYRSIKTMHLQQFVFLRIIFNLVVL